MTSIADRAPGTAPADASVWRNTPFGVVGASASAAPGVFELTGTDAAAWREARSSAERPVAEGRSGHRVHRSASTAQDDSLRSVIAWAVPALSASSVEPAAQPFEPAVWADLLSTVVNQRIAGLLWAAIEAGMPVTPTQRVGAATMAHDAAKVAVSLEATAQWTLDVLGREGIDARLIKGLATARAIHPVPELRDSGDVDLLVAPQDFDRAQATLAAAGLAPEIRWGAGAAGFAKEQLFVSPHGVEIDLHQSLNYGGRWRRLTPLLMERGLSMDRGIPVPIAAHSPGLATLNVEGLFVSAAISASRSDGRVGGLFDLAAISHDPRLDPARLRALLDSVGLGPALAPVLLKASRYFAVSDDAAEVVRSGRAGAIHRACARVEASESGARYVYSCLSGKPTQWAPGLRALAFPDASHFENDPRSGGRAQRVVRQTLRLLTPSAWKTSV